MTQITVDAVPRDTAYGLVYLLRLPYFGSCIDHQVENVPFFLFICLEGSKHVCAGVIVCSDKVSDSAWWIMKSRQFNLAIPCEYDVLWKMSISYGFRDTQQQSDSQAWSYISVDDH